MTARRKTIGRNRQLQSASYSLISMRNVKVVALSDHFGLKHDKLVSLHMDCLSLPALNWKKWYIRILMDTNGQELQNGWGWKIIQSNPVISREHFCGLHWSAKQLVISSFSLADEANNPLTLNYRTCYSKVWAKKEGFVLFVWGPKCHSGVVTLGRKRRLCPALHKAFNTPPERINCAILISVQPSKVSLPF